MAQLQKENASLRKQLAAQRRAVNENNRLVALTKAKNGSSPRISGGGNRLIAAAPAAYGSEMKSQFDFFRPGGKFKDSIGIRGTEWIGPVTVPANAVSGTVVRNDYVQPGEFSDSRLAMFGQMYEKFRFKRLRYKFIPAVGSNQPGSLLLAYDRDISDANPPPGTQGVRQCMSWADSVQGNAWTSHVLDAKLECPDSGYYTDEAVGGDERLCYQGQFYVLVVNPFNNAADLVIGNMILEYELELFVPQLQTRIPTALISNSGSVPPLITDALRGFTAPAAGRTVSANTVPSFVPKPTSAGATVNAIRLAEGLYRLWQKTSVSATATGPTTYAAPTCIPLEPSNAPAPQPLVRVLNSFTGDQIPSAGSSYPAIMEALISIPKGGADVFQAYSALANPTSTEMLLNKMGPYLPDLSSIF